MQFPNGILNFQMEFSISKWNSQFPNKILNFRSMWLSPSSGAALQETQKTSENFANLWLKTDSLLGALRLAKLSQR